MPVLDIMERAARWIFPRAQSTRLRAETPIACLELDHDGVLRRVNRAACELLGYREAQMAGYPLWHFMPGQERATARMDLLRKLGGAAAGTAAERIFLRQDGSEALVEMREELLITEDGAMHGLRAWLLEVGARREREHMLTRRVEELTRANQALSQFALAAAHDLHEPLRMVAAYATLMEKRYKGRLDADADDFLSLAADGAARMQRLVDGLLSWSIAGGVEPACEPRPAVDAIEEALANLRGMLEESGARVRYGPLPALPVAPARLTQIFQNLVANAVRYRSVDPPVVEIACEETAAEWRFSVTDNGIGVDPRDASRIFEPLQRIHPVPGSSGCGMGLAITRRAVESLGGRIWVLARRPPGATFYFTVRKPEAPKHV